MDRSPLLRHTSLWLSLVMVVVTLIPAGGCAGLLASGMYLWQGGNVLPAECKELEGQRVVVVCRPPASSEFSHAGAARQLSRSVSLLLREQGKKIEVVDPREVDKWLDESDEGDFIELGHAVKADRMLVIDMANFDLYKGPTLYQGNSEITLTIHDMTTRTGDIIWERSLGEMPFPSHSPIPAQDKSVKTFQREYVGVLAEQIGIYFYKHDAHATFALDALANR